MIIYEYIDRHVHVVTTSTMIHLTIVANDYVTIQALYFDAKKGKSISNMLVLNKQLKHAQVQLSIGTILLTKYSEYLPAFHHYL
jgi:hypothetical protein